MASVNYNAPFGAAVTGQRHCSDCSMKRDIAGGKYVVSNKGRNRRWRCRSCLDNAKRRAHGK